MELTVFFLLWTVIHLAEALNGFTKPERITYSKDFLLQWSNFQDLRGVHLVVPDLNSFADQTSGKGDSTGAFPRKIRKRGKRAGLRLRLRKQPLSRTPLPSIILSNARSLRNKVDELQANVRFQHEFRDACLLAITETWLSERDSDTELAIDSFGSPVRIDRDAAAAGMSRGGGICLYVNQRYCKNVIVRDRLY